MAEGKAPAAVGTEGAAVNIKGVNPKPPNAPKPPKAPMPPKPPMPPMPGAKDEVGASMADGKAPAAVGTEGAVPNIIAVGKKAGTPPMPGAVVVGVAIRGVAATPGAIADGRTTAMPLDEKNPNNAIIIKLVTMIFKKLLFIDKLPFLSIG